MAENHHTPTRSVNEFIASEVVKKEVSSDGEFARYFRIEEKKADGSYVTAGIPGAAGQRLVGPDKLITRRREISIHFGFPLLKGITFDFQSPEGFTRRRILHSIRAGYAPIYGQRKKYGPSWVALSDLCIQGCELRANCLTMILGPKTKNQGGQQ